MYARKSNDVKKPAKFFSFFLTKSSQLNKSKKCDSECGIAKLRLRLPCLWSMV